jgi:hypothetical protein
MNDRYSRAMLTLIAMSMLSVALSSLWNSQPVRAQPIPVRQKCVWTYIDGKGDIGRDGDVKLRGDNWKRLSEEGWQLKAATLDSNSSNSFRYVFERCE